MKQVMSWLFALLLISNHSGLGQSKDEEIKRLQKLAKENEERALKAEALAKQYSEEANQANENLKHLRYQVLAKAYSLKAIEINDPEQAGLVALTGLQFLERGEGYEYDSDVYSGLISALNRYNRFPQKLTFNDKPTQSVQTYQHLVLSVSGNQVVKWTQQNDSWTGKELMNVIQGTITSIQTNKNLMGLEIKDDQKFIFQNLNLLMLDKSLVETTDGDKPFDPFKTGFFFLSNSGFSILRSSPSTTKEVIASKEKLIAIATSANGSKVAGAGESGNLYIWSTEDYSSVSRKVLQSNTHFTTLSFMPGGDGIVFGDDRGVIRIFNLNTLYTERELISHKSNINAIAFSHSGKLMATSSVNKTIRIWNLQQLNRMPLTINLEYVVGSLTFSPDDGQILFAPKNTNSNQLSKFNLQAWPINFEQMHDELCGLVGRNLNKEEQETFIPSDLPYEKTCPNIPDK